MRTAVIISKKDEASINIGEALSVYFPGGIYKKSKLYVTDKEPVYFDEAEELEEQLIIFATKHSSKQGQPGLSCHTSGNWGNADLGGEKRNFSTSPAFLLREVLLHLGTLADTNQEVFQEVTHHGPTISKPSLFIEIGSKKEEWIKEENGKKIAEVIIKILDLVDEFESYKNFEKYYRDKFNTKVALAVGGLHHMPNFKRLLDDIAIGHTCAKYNLDDFDEDTFEKAINATAEKVDLVVVDWKGLSKHKQKISEILNKKEIEWKKTKEIISSSSRLP